MNRTSISTSAILLSSALAAVSLPVFAVEDSGVTISIMGGQAMFADDRALEDEMFYSLGLGYDYGKHWAVELGYVSTEPDVEDTNISVDIEHFRLDGLYYFGSHHFRPYLVGGIGQANFNADLVDSEESFVNAGAGFKYSFNQYIALRGDARAVYSVDEEETDMLIGLGLLFRFGHSSDSSTSTAVTPAPLAETDSDGDGIVDSRDQCPATPKGVIVDSVGCAVDNDVDKDGVVNVQDQCPDTSTGAKVDEDGCYLTLTEKVSTSLKINFANNSAQVLDGAVDEVKKVAEFMRQYPQTEVRFEGYTDDRGSADYNRELSQNRANSVAAILIEQFNIDRSRVMAIGYGEENPLVDNSTPENRAKNRRVVAVVSATVEKIQK